MSVNAAKKVFTLKNLYTTSALAASFIAVSGSANADGVVNGTFVSGSGTITQAPNLTTITVHTGSSITEFKDYNIGTGQEVHYQKDFDGSARNLSRVTGGNESRILGSLTSNGVSVYLINPAGVFFGQGAVVNVPNLVVSTTDISNKNFTEGNFHFDVKGNSNARIENHGTITVGDTGLAALVAPTVVNDGIIVANKGKVALGAGEEFTLDMYGDKLINFAVSNDENARLVQQSGKIAAADGVVLLTAQDANKVVNNVVNLDGVVEAKTVKIHGDQIVLGGDINASSSTGGGDVSITGRKITVSKTGKVSANATVDGNGGNISVVADSDLSLDGTLEAKGAGTGNGGFIEASGKESIAFGENLVVDTTDANGGAGELLLDPSNVTIGSSFQPFNQNYLNNTALEVLLGLNNLTIETNKLGDSIDNLNVLADITKSSFVGNRTLTLKSNSINIASGVTIGADVNKLNVNLYADSYSTISGIVKTNGGSFNVANKAGTGNTGTFTLSGGSTLNAGAGAVNIKANTAKLGSTITAGSITGNANIVNILSNAAKIQQGVSIAKTGGEVDVAAGTYDESLVIDKNLTLNGAGSNLTIIKPTSAPTQSFKDFYDGTYNDSIILVKNANVDINTLSVDGSGASNLVNAVNHRLVGIGYDNAGGTVYFSTIKNISDNGNVGGTAIVAQSDSSDSDSAHTFNVKSSTIQDFETSGIEVDGNLLTANLGQDGGNFVKGSSTANTAIKAGHGVAGDVKATTFLGFNKSGAIEIALDGVKNGFTIDSNDLSYGNAGTTAISVRNSSSVQVTNNQIKNHTTGIDAVNSKDLVIGSDFISNNDTGVIITGSLNAIVNNSTIEKGTYGFVANSSDNSLIQSSTIQNASQDGVHVVNSANLKLNNVNLFNNGTNGAYINNSAGANIIDSHVSGNGTGAYILNSINSVVGSSEFKNNGVGVFLEGSASGIVNNSNIHNNTFGVYAHNSSGALVQSSSVNDNTSEGIHADSSTGLTVNNTKVIGNSSKGISLISSSNAKVIGGSEIYGSTNGINATGSTGLQVLGSDIHNNTTGINLLSGSNDAIITSDIHNNTTGIYADASTGLTVKNANVHNNTTGIDIENGSKNATINGGLIHDNSGTGLKVKGSKGLLVTGANFYTNTGTGIDIDTSANATISNTQVSGSNYGVHLYNSDGFVINSGSNIHNNTTGVWLGIGTGAKIKDSTIASNATGIDDVITDGLTVSNTQITGNTYGITLDNSTNTTIKGKTNISGNVTGLNSSSSSGLIFDDSTISHNTTGAFIIGGSNNLIKNSTITANSDGVYGFVTNGLTLDNDLITYNNNGVNLLYTSANNYVTNSTLEYNNNAINSNGSSGLTVDSNTIIKFNAVGVNISGGSQNTIANSTVADNGTGINISGSNSNTVYNTKVKENGTGISVNGGVGNVVNQSHVFSNGTGIIGNATIGLVVEGSEINNSGTGIDLSNGSTGATVTSTNVHDNGTGISVADSAGVFVSGNTKVHDNANGLIADNATSLHLLDSSFNSNQYYGADISNSANVVVDNSKFNSNTNGLRLAKSGSASVTGSKFNSNQVNGFEAKKSGSLFIGGNSEFAYNGEDGIKLVNSDDATIKKSQVFENGKDGVNVRYSDGLKIKNSDVYSNGRDGVHLKGSDHATISDGSDVSYNYDNGIYAKNSDYLTVKDSSVNWNGTSNSVIFLKSLVEEFPSEGGYGDGIHLINSDNATVKDSTVNHNVHDGIYAKNSDYLTVKNSHVNWNGTSSSGVEGDGGDEARIETVSYNSGNGIELINSDNATVTGSHVNHNGLDGIYADNSKNLSVDSSKIKYNGAAGVELIDSNKASITDSKIIGNYIGILANSSTKLDVVRSKVADSYIGILLENSSDSAKIKDTSVVQNYIGAEVLNSANVTVKGSKINNNTYGLYADDATNLKLLDSHFNSNSKYGAKVYASSGLDVEGSKFNSNKNGLIIIGSDDAFITGSTFKGNAKDGIKLKNSDRVQIENSIFLGNNIGVESINSNKGKLKGDTFTDNTTGVELRKSSSKWDIRNTQINGGTTGLEVTGNGSSVEFKGDKNQFNGQSGQYISLDNGAMFGQTLHVDNVTFDGVLASTATDDQSFVIEDKIHHKMDDNGVGLVLWRDQQLFATKNNLGIQQGIDVADSDGWTVNIASGIYNENLTIDKGITLIGRGKGTGEGTTTIDGGEDVAVFVNAGDKTVLLKNLSVTTEGAPFAIVVDGTSLTPPSEGEGDGPIFLDEPSLTPGPLNFSMSNVLFSGTQSNAALQFQNATTVGGVHVDGVEFRSVAPTGWKFLSVTGQAPKNVYNAGGDLDFGNTVFANSYSLADIQLVNTTMDGFAENVTFEGDGGSPFAREDRVIHYIDNPALGTIFYSGYQIVLDSFLLGNLANDIANRTDIKDVYYNSVSSAGRIYDNPSLKSAKSHTFNAQLDTKVNINGGGSNPAGTIILPTQSAAQLAGLAPAAGGDNTPNGFNGLKPGAGGKPGNSFASNCSVSFGNDFLSDGVNGVSGACQ